MWFQLGAKIFPNNRANIILKSDAQHIQYIVTHPGSSHKDELLACAVILHFHPVNILRRDPTEAELQDPDVAVIDIGHLHQPELSNFDHHQFPKDHVPACSLSLVLQHLGLYEDAKHFCEWMETLEWFDSKGAIATSKWLGTTHENIRRLNSPIDVSLLKWFASETEWQPGSPIWEMLRRIGSDLVNYLNTMHDRMEFIEKNSEVWDIGSNPVGEPVRMLFLPRTDPLPKDPSLGLALYLDQHSPKLQGLIYPDRRGEGYGLSRYNDNPNFDFTQIQDETDVHFAHARGFLAKTHSNDRDRLHQLATKSIVQTT